ncbi:MAG TPA: hypothetical protein VL177_19950, partial [Terriglobales bacterium]|nr:hypothetical protein [Terriglobales bacterium]
DLLRNLLGVSHGKRCEFCNTISDTLAFVARIFLSLARLNWEIRSSGAVVQQQTQIAGAQ